MTIAELNRRIQSYQRVKKAQAREQAAHNYVLANLIGRGIASYLSNDINMPKIEEVYSTLFDEKAEETKIEKENLKAELSALRFKQFANFHNKKYENQGVAKTE